MGVRGEVGRAVVVWGGLFLALSVTLGPSDVGARGRDDDASEASRPTGVCEVPIRDSYNRDDTHDHVQCSGDRDFRPWLVTIRNASDVAVFVNEWYLDGWHGQTTIPARQTKTLPIFALADLWVGACWPGESPGTCQRGTPFRFATVEILSWVDATHMNELWIRGDWEPPAQGGSTGDSWAVVINNSEYPVRLTWPDLGTNERGEWNYVTVPPDGRTQPIPPGRGVKGKKDFGNGEVARVTYAATGGGENPDIYHLVVTGGRHGAGPEVPVTWLDGSWCSVHFHNLGPKGVVLMPWIFPPLIEGGRNLLLPVGHSGRLSFSRGTLHINAFVGSSSDGEFTRVRASDWRKCP